jgi:hypothetical protein
VYPAWIAARNPIGIGSNYKSSAKKKIFHLPDHIFDRLNGQAGVITIDPLVASRKYGGRQRGSIFFSKCPYRGHPPGARVFFLFFLSRRSIEHCSVRYSVSRSFPGTCGNSFILTHLRELSTWWGPERDQSGTRAGPERDQSGTRAGPERDQSGTRAGNMTGGRKSAKMRKGRKLRKAR